MVGGSLSRSLVEGGLGSRFDISGYQVVPALRLRL
jgi:hypothetical protein